MAPIKLHDAKERFRPKANEELGRAQKLERHLENTKAAINRALRIFFSMTVDKNVTVQFFTDKLKYIEPQHYKDVTGERSLHGFCGYPLCPTKSPPTKFGEQKFIIRHNKVYDIAERRNFCSNKCYEASEIVLSQVPKSPLYLRDTDKELQNFKLIIPDLSDLKGKHGKLVNITGIVHDPEERDISLKNLSLSAKNSVSEAFKGDKDIKNTSNSRDTLRDLLNKSSKYRCNSEEYITDVQLSTADGSSFQPLTTGDHLSETERSSLQQSSPGDRLSKTNSGSLSQSTPVVHLNKTDCSSIENSSPEFRLSKRNSSSLEQSTTGIHMRGTDGSSLEQLAAGIHMNGTDCSSSEQSTTGIHMSETDCISVRQQIHILCGNACFTDRPRSLLVTDSTEDLGCESNDTVQGAKLKGPSEAEEEQEESTELEHKERIALEQEERAEQELKERREQKQKERIEQEQKEKLEQVQEIEVFMKEWMSLDSLVFILGESYVRDMLQDVLDRKILSDDGVVTNAYARYIALCKKLANTEGENNQDGESEKGAKLDYEQMQKDLDAGVSTILDDRFFPTGERQRIVMKKLEHPLSAMVAELGLDEAEIRKLVASLVVTFDLSPKNFSFTTEQWKFVALVLLKMLSVRYPIIKKALCGGPSHSLVTSYLSEVGLDAGYFDRLLKYLTTIVDILTKKSIKKGFVLTANGNITTKYEELD